jgi:hypothetical protein
MIRRILFLTFLLSSMSLLSCDYISNQNILSNLTTDPNTVTKKDMTKQYEIFKNKVIILLKKQPDLNSHFLDIQDFVENGKSFIPVFTTKEELIKSTQGADLPFPKYQIDGLLLLSVMNGNEVLRVNPSLKDEVFFKASDLKEYFKEDIEQFMTKMDEQ